MEENGNSSPRKMRIFSDDVAIKSGRGKIVVSPKQTNNLREEILKIIDQVQDEELRTVLKADIEHAFIIWYGRGKLNLEAKDFIINPNAEITSDLAIDRVPS